MTFCKIRHAESVRGPHKNCHSSEGKEFSWLMNWLCSLEKWASCAVWESWLFSKNVHELFEITEENRLISGFKDILQQGEPS